MQVLMQDYYMENGKHQKLGSYTYTYDAEGNLLSVHSGIDTNIRRLIYTNYYDENGLLVLTQYQYGEDQQGEKYVFGHDEKKRVSSLTWWGAGESPIMEYFYRYNEMDLLEAKETWFGTLDGDPMRDAFQYFYNEKSQLIEEKEFYPHMGFVPRFRKTFEYYPELGVTQE
jgi:hypothetical protein